MDQNVSNAILGAGATLSGDQSPQRINLFNADGSPTTIHPAIPPIDLAGAIGTVAKTAAVAEPKANTLVALKFTNGNSANSPTVSFSGGAARAIQLGGVASTGAKLTVAANGIVVFYFDGTILHQLGTVA